MPVCHKLHLCKEDLARALSQRRERIKEEAVKMVNGEERAKYFSPSPPGEIWSATLKTKIYSKENNSALWNLVAYTSL